ncbi:peptidoglycan DD-metalloendopeptidase family protein [Flavobacterium sp.]|uniref:peptidoglycan DD-metalloendopeptidase family protein n=1 Tax=Flavobacterium sp. TaxID=239 RepID=UPI003750CD79
MKGVKTITGSKYPRIGEATFYEVTAFHQGTVVIDPNTIKWKLYQFKDGQWDELSGPVKTGKKVSYNFPQKWYAKQLLIEAYIFDAQAKAPPGFIVKPCMGDRKINNTEILNTEGKPITEMPKYGQHITLRATTENMVGEVLKLSVWERDTYSDEGHDPNGNQILWSGNSKKVDNKGFGEERILLSPDLMMKAGKSMFDGSEHEYYLLVEADKMKTISATTQVSTEIVLSPGDHQIAKREPIPEKKTKLTDQKPVKIKNATGFDPIVVEGITKAVVDMPEELPKVEGIITAYFAKEEFTKETDEAAGEHKYTFANANKDIDKDKIAGIIKKKVDAQVKVDKKYAKLDDIKTALTETSYAKGAIITFNLCKLGANFIKINSAPLEEEVYVVAKTFLLDGKEVTLKIKEKDAVLVGADGDLNVLEAKENGAEITALKATVENGIAKVKIKLRPKADDVLVTWKEKLANGKEDGTHKYDVNKPFTVSGDLDKIAGNIEKNSNKALAPNHVVKKADISKLLTEGATYTTTNSFQFPRYKTEKVVENLWLKAECTGTKKYEGDYLKKDGEYFVVGKQCECEPRVRAFMRMLRVKEGTVGEKGYTTLFNNEVFTDMSKHPEKVINAGSYSSSAAGAYQIMQDTYKGFQGYYKDEKKNWKYAEKLNYTKRYNINSFDQESQDKLCLVIFKHNYIQKRPNGFFYKEDGTARDGRSKFNNAFGDIIQMIIDNNFDKAILTSSLCWASLPDAPYGQPTGTKEECKANYEKFLKEELEGKSDLYLKKGFLKEFGYNCCENKGNAKWQNPLKNNQITIHTFGGSIRPWRSAFGRVRTDMTGSDNGARPHHGLDLFAEIGTEVFACLPGEVVSLTPGTGYGNGFVFKIDDNYLNEFKNQRRSYSPYYIKSDRTYDSKKYDIDGYGDFEEYEGASESESVYLMYAHLSEVTVKLNDKITESNMDTVLGKTGTSGATNTKGPHLHFEIRSKQSPSGYTDRYNPAYYIDYKNEEQITTSERKIQDDAAK